MENMNISQVEGFNYTSITNSSDSKYEDTTWFIHHVVTCVIISVGLPLTLVAIYSLRSMVKDGNVAPLYVINLLITDILQFCCMIATEVALQGTSELGETRDIFLFFHFFFLIVSVCFMVCISLERYLVIAWPLWYRFRRTIKISVGVCVLVWILAGLLALMVYLFSSYTWFNTFSGICLLLNFPPLIFFLVGTVKALSASISVPSDEKHRIVGVLVLVLLIYLLLFLPTVIWFLKGGFSHTDHSQQYLSFMFLKVSPLADLFLYIFMKKGAIDKLLSSLCRCRMDSSDSISPSVEMTTP